MNHQEELISEDFKEIYGDEISYEIEEYLRHYPFPIQEY